MSSERRILIVDDSPAMRALIARVLVLAGVAAERIAEAGDGAAALALLRARPHALVVLDITMPVLDGEALLGRLRADPALAGLAVVVVTSDRSGPLRERLSRLGAEVLVKPFRPEQLRDRLAALGAVP